MRTTLVLLWTLCVLSTVSLAKSGGGGGGGGASTSTLTPAAIAWTIPAFTGNALKDYKGLLHYLIHDTGLRLTINQFTCDNPHEIALSPDGSKVAVSLQDKRFAISIGGGFMHRDDCQIVLIELKTGAARLITLDKTRRPGNSDSRLPKFTADGKSLFYWTSASNVTSGGFIPGSINPDTWGTVTHFIASYDLASGVTKTISALDTGRIFNVGPRNWLPYKDGKSLALTLKTVWERDLATNDFVSMTNNDRAQEATVFGTAIREQGQSRQMATCEGSMMASDLWMTDLATGKDERVSTDDQYVDCVNKTILFPVGNWILVNNIGFNVVTKETKSFLTDENGVEAHPQYMPHIYVLTPDGQSLMYVHNAGLFGTRAGIADSQEGIFIKNLQTGALDFVPLEKRF